MYIEVQKYVYYYFDILIIRDQIKPIYFILIDCQGYFDDCKIQNIPLSEIQNIPQRKLQKTINFFGVWERNNFKVKLLY